MSDIIVVIKTNAWDIKLKLFPEHAPKTVANFLNLIQNNFYDTIKFHRVIEDFMIQTWCPMGIGTGWPGYTFEDEFHPELRHSKPWMLSMANSWRNTNWSQFFITHVATPWLDWKHSIFGEVVGEEDQNIVNKIRQDDVIETIQILWEVDEFLSDYQENINQWNAILSR
jgi:peptidyl-prolyl cis-trans isomerase B (cyclophilin B)